jgi:hypothetical protein
MTNISYWINDNGIEFVIIDRGNGEFTSMPKVEYDKQAEQSTPIVSSNE